MRKILIPSLTSLKKSNGICFFYKQRRGIGGIKLFDAIFADDGQNISSIANNAENQNLIIDTEPLINSGDLHEVNTVLQTVNNQKKEFRS